MDRLWVYTYDTIICAVILLVEEMHEHNLSLSLSLPPCYFHAGVCCGAFQKNRKTKEVDGGGKYTVSACL